MKSSTTEGYLSLLGGFLYHLIMGCVYLFGAISIYLASYYRQFDDSVTTRLLMMFLPIRGILSLFLMPIGAYLHTIWSARKVVLIGATAILFSTWMLTWSRSPAEFIIYYSFGFGVATLGYIPAIQCNWKHFPNNKGMVSGVILCGFAMGSFVFSFLCGKIVNPEDRPVTIHIQHGEVNDSYYDVTVYQNVPKLFNILFILWAVLLFVSVLTLKPPTSMYKDISLISEASHNESVFDSLLRSSSMVLFPVQRVERRFTVDLEFEHDYMNNECPSVSAGVKSSCFWIIIVMLTFSNFLDLFFGFAYKELGQIYQYNDGFLTNVGCVYALANGMGRIFWGISYEKYPFNKLYFFLLLGQTFFAGTLLLVGSIKALFAIWVVSTIFFISGNFTLFPPLCSQLFGVALGGQLYGYVASSFATSSILVFFGNLYIVPAYGYSAFLILSACLSLSNFVWLYMLNIKPEWPHSIYVTLRSKENINSKIMNMNRALSAIVSDSGLSP